MVFLTSSIPPPSIPLSLCNPCKIQVIINGVRFYKNKYRILHLVQSNSGKNHKFREEWQESSPGKRDLWMLAGSRLNVSQQWALAGKKANHIWGAVSLAGQKRWLPCCIQRGCGLTSIAVWRSGPHSLRGVQRSLNESRRGQQKWWKGLKACPVRSR